MNLIDKLIVSVVGDTAALKKSLADSNKQLSGFGGAVQKHSAAFMKTGTVMMGFAGAIGIAAVKVGKEFDKAYSKIRTGTGKTGKVLEGLKKDFRAVVKDVPNSLDEVSTAIADINTRLGLTGKPLQAMAKQMLNLARITETDVNAVIRTSTRLFGDWDVAVEDQAETLDYLYKVSQSTGVGIDRLSDMVTTYGVQLRTVGFTMEESLALMGKWEKEGVSAEKMLGGLSMALGRFAKAQKEPEEAMRRLMKQIEEAPTVGKAMELGVEALGTRAGPDFALAVREGRFAVEDFVAELAGSSETINQAAEDTMTLTEKFNRLKNQAKLAIEPLAKKLMNELSPALEKVTDKLGDLDEEQLDNIASSVLFATKVLAVGGAILFVLPKIYQLRTAMIALRGTMLGAASVYTAVAAAMLGIGQAGDWAASKIDNYYLASLARATLPHAYFMYQTKSMIEVIRGLQDNTLTWSEYIRMNGREIDEWAQKHRKGIEDIEGFNEALESAEKFVKNYGDELPLASAAMVDLIQNYQDGTLSAEGFKIGIEELRKATQNGKVDIEEAAGGLDDFADKQELARIKVDAHAKAQKEAKQPIEDTTESIEDQEEAAEELRKEIDKLFDSLFELYNLNQSVTEAAWDYEDAQVALKKVTEDANSTDRDRQKALFKVQDEMEDVIDAIWREYSAEGTSLQRKEELRKKYIEVKDEAVDRGFETEEAFKGIDEQFGIMTMNIYSDIYRTIIPSYAAMYDKGKEIDDQVIEPEIKADISRAMKNLDEFKKKMDSIQSKTVTITYKGAQIAGMKPHTGGYITPAGTLGFAGGGIASSDGFSLPMLTAAQGLTIPSFDNGGILAMLDKYEVILNSPQQLTLAKLIFGLAEGKYGAEGGGGAIIHIHNEYNEELASKTFARLFAQYVGEINK